MRWFILTVIGATLIAGGSVAAHAGDPLSPLNERTVVVTGRSATPTNPDIFGTVALNAGVTAYGARWRRVSAADTADPRVIALAAAAREAGSDALARLGSVQVEVGRRVQWRRDLDTYKVSDYWAHAGETLTRGVGDSEDIAILKMQILKAAGFAARDIYLCVGRDHLRGADTRLLVRVGSDFYTLDDRSPRPSIAADAHRFVPVITLGRNSAWIHGRRLAGRANRPVVIARR